MNAGNPLLNIDTSKLTREQKEELLLLVEEKTRREARDRLNVFAGRQGFVPAKHHLLIIEHLEAIERRDIQNLLVITPPGASKSTYSSILFPAWYLGRNPKHLVLAASNTMELAERFGRKVRSIVSSPDFQNIFGIKLSEESAAAARWETDKGGEYFAVGVGGSVVGRRSDCLVAGTKIQAHNCVINIEQVKVGDYVLSCKQELEQEDKPVYRRVLAVSRRETDEFFRIHTASGRLVEATGNHRIYVNGGFREVSSVVAGDVLLCALREADDECGERACQEIREGGTRREVSTNLRNGVRGEVDGSFEVERGCNADLRMLREGIHEVFQGEHAAFEERRTPGLQCEMCNGSHGSEEASGADSVQLRLLRERGEQGAIGTRQEIQEESGLQTCVQPVMCHQTEQRQKGDAPDSDVQQLRKRDHRGAAWRPNMLGGMSAGNIKEVGSRQTINRNEEMRMLRDGVQTSNESCDTTVLLDDVQERGTRPTDEGREQPNVSPRSFTQPLSAWAAAPVQGREETGADSGQPQMRCVRISEGIERASHRHGPAEQRCSESGDDVLRLPCGSACRGKEQTERDTVSLVERVHRREVVFDLQIEDTACFFANDILVHNCLILDDVVRSKEDVESEGQRNKVWDWYVSDILTRLKPNAAKVLVNTRWHEDDLAGRILDRDGKDWTVLHLEMENTREDDPLGRAIGARLWPEWFTQQMVDDAKKDIGSWNALYQGNPVPDGGGEFKKAWVEYYDTTPDRKKVTTLMLVDPANDKGKRSDYTAIWVIGCGGDGNFYILDIVRDRLNLAERIDKVFTMHRKWRPVEVRYEKFGLAIDVDYLKIEQDRRSYRFKVREVAGTRVSKEDRIRRLIPYFRDGKMIFPREFNYTDSQGHTSDLVHVFIEEELAAFPVSKHDDLLDSLSRLAEPGLVLPKHVPEEERQLMFAAAEDTAFVPLDDTMGY